jgi:hypothetical protein
MSRVMRQAKPSLASRWSPRSMRLIRAALILPFAIASLALCDVALAERPATTTEADAIRAATIKFWRTSNACGDGEPYHGVHVSTVDPRYALAATIGRSCTLFVTAIIVRRPTTRSKRWSYVTTLGGSLQVCSEFTALVPGRVLRDLKVEGAGKGGIVIC